MYDYSSKSKFEKCCYRQNEGLVSCRRFHISIVVEANMEETRKKTRLNLEHGSKNHKMVPVGRDLDERDLDDHLVSTALLQAGSPTTRSSTRSGKVYFLRSNLRSGVFVTEIALITHQCLRYWWILFTQHQVVSKL